MRVFIRMFTPIHPHKLVNASRSVLTCPNIGKMFPKALFLCFQVIICKKIAAKLIKSGSKEKGRKG